LKASASVINYQFSVIPKRSHKIFPVDGLLVIDKPEGITSHDVVNRVRRILGIKRVGHTGTLDPFATGVMVVLVGRATRLAQFIDKDEKEYEATIRFGFETDTGDVTGMQTSEYRVRNEVAAVLGDTDWNSVLARFRGGIEQVPPMYSAKKVGGKKLYESARKGVEIERKPVRVTIKVLELLDRDQDADTLCLRVVCSAGTYIRTLAENIGRTVGVGAHLTDLRRTRSGRFDLSQALTVDRLAKLDEAASALLPIDTAVEHLPKCLVPDERVERTRQGLSTRIADATFADGQSVRMTSTEGELIAIGVYSVDEGSVKPKVVLV
jgi:tRNA pseudouridine55 synthase